MKKKNKKDWKTLEKKAKEVWNHGEQPFQNFEDAIYAVPILYDAVQEIISVLGPKPGCGCIHCEGCDYEINAALNAAYMAFLSLGLKHQYEDHIEFKKTKKRLEKWMRKNQ